MTTDIITRGYAADIVYKDAKERMVYAIATGPKMDLDGQGCDPAWLREAVPTWMKRGNVRLMHNNSIPPVGKAKQAIETPDNEWAVAIKVVNDETWKLIDEGLLTGISIGAKNATVVNDSRFPHGLIKGGDLIEMSFVDYPAYQYSTLSTDKFSFFKRAGNSIHYNGVVIEDDGVVTSEMVKVAGTAELPGEVRDRLERARQKTEEIKAGVATAVSAQRWGQWTSPYAGAPMVVIPGKTVAADVTKAAISKLVASTPIVKADDKEPVATVKTEPRKLPTLPATFKVAASATHGLVVKYLDSMTGEDSPVVLPIEQYIFPDESGDGQVTLTGTEAQHNKPANAVLGALKTLAIQELQEDDFEFGDVECIADIARQFLNWVYCEQMEAENDAYQAAMAQVSAATVSMSAEPDRTKRHAMARAISTTLAKVSTSREVSVTEPNTDTAGTAPETTETDAEKAAKKAPGKAGAIPDDATADEDAAAADEAADAKKKPATKVADPEVEKIGKTISRATADKLLALADNPGVPAGVRLGLQQMAGFVLQGESDSQEHPIPAVVVGDAAATGDLPREKLDLDSFGAITAAVTASFVTPTGEEKAAKPDVAKAFVGGVEKLAKDAATAALESFLTSDSFVAAIAAGVKASREATEAADAAKVATTKVTELGEKVTTDIEKVRSDFTAELDRIKKLPQPAKGAASEQTVAEKTFAANPDVTKVAETEAATIGDSIIKRAAAGDLQAQRLLREAVTGGSVTPKDQDAAAKAAYVNAVKDGGIRTPAV